MSTTKWFKGLTAVVAGAMLLAGCGRTGMAPQTAAAKAGAVKTASVPAGFLWGVSTAGQQWEGYDTNSNWFHWWNSGKTEDKNPFGANGLKMYGEDTKLAKGLGCNAFRTSLEWSRIEPQPGVIDPEAVAFYHRLLDNMREQGLTPVITLHHFGHPQWVEAQGGWESSKTPALFAKFAAFCAKEYGSKVDLWLTFNEPNTYLLGGWVAGAFPPGKQNPFDGLKAMRNMVKGHGMAYDAVHENDPNAKVSFNMYTAEFQLGALNQSPEERAADRLGHDDVFMDEVMGLRTAKGGAKVDFAALDYYCKFRISLPFVFPKPDTWEVYPEGMYKAIKRYYAKYKLPVLIAENGMATKDGQPRADGWTRSRYLVAHLEQMQRAMNEGVPVMGYIHWSITDNWEWGSYTPTFGLYKIDARKQNWKRIPADGADAFRSIVHAGGVTPALKAKYGLLPTPWTEGGKGTPVNIRQ
jgi:beta-glucosidase